MRLKDKIALVTGGAAGLGIAIARRLAQEGASVTITDIQGAIGRRAADELGCDFVEQDVASEEGWRQIMGGMEKRRGALHILVNNAGVEGPFDSADPESASLADWQMVNRVNVEGVFLGCRAAIPLIRQSGGGAIINLSSTAALSATPNFLAYGSSKAAVRHLTKSVAMHCARNGSKVRCNSVHPAIVLTPMLRRIAENLGRKRGVSPERVLEDFMSDIPQGEFQEPEDIANATLFLASDEAKHITGLAMVVDGGCTLSAG
jgi:3(or 17)beta-hydroxysteroid dehydrogenase